MPGNSNSIHSCGYVVKKDLRSHSQSRGSVKGQRWELYPSCGTEIYTLLTNVKVEKSASILRISSNLAVWVGPNWSAVRVGLAVAVRVGATVEVAVHQFDPRWLRRADYHEVWTHNFLLVRGSWWLIKWYVVEKVMPETTWGSVFHLACNSVHFGLRMWPYFGAAEVERCCTNSLQKFGSEGC